MSSTSRPNAHPISDRLWHLLLMCWETAPERRPSMNFIVDALEDIDGDWISSQQREQSSLVQEQWDMA
jgi:hypothetical protein